MRAFGGVAVKTAETIEAQEERKKAEKSTVSRAHNSTPVSTKQPEDGTERLKPFRFKPGISGNPGGRPKRDLASEIAQALFEQDGPAIFAAFQRVLRKGSPYAFQVLADRAFGKLKEVHQVEHGPYHDASDEEIEKRIAELKAKLGWPAESTTDQTTPDTKIK
jgi:hypothetical protein